MTSPQQTDSPAPMTTQAAAQEELKTLREWIAENDAPAELVSEICPMRSLLALACTMHGWDPGSAARSKVSRDAMVALLREARAHHLQILATAEIPVEQEHLAPILPAAGVLYAVIAKRPTAGQIQRVQDAVMAASVDQDAAKGLRTTLLTQMLSACTLYPAQQQRELVYNSYGGLRLELASKVQRLGSEAVEEIVGK